MPSIPEDEAVSGPVLVIGAANVDILGHRAHTGPAEDSVPGSVRRAPGGVGRNIAECLARLEVPVRLVSRIGADTDGDWLLAVTAAAGVDVDLVERTSEDPTPTYVGVHDHRGHTIAGVSDMRAFDAIDLSHLQPALARTPPPAALVIDANLPAGALAWIVRERPAGVALFADAVSGAKAPRLTPLLERIHTLKLNLAEARALSGVSADDWQACAAALLARGAQRVVLSLGAAGVGYADRDRQWHRAAPAGAIGSDTGAGDALTAGLEAAWVRGLAPAAQLDFALGCAGVTLQATAAVGDALNPERVRAWIEEHQ